MGRVARVLALVVFIGLIQSVNAAVAAPPDENGGRFGPRPAQADPVPYSEEQTGSGDPSTEAVAYQPVGEYEPKGDYVHLSSYYPRAISAHGWWINISGPATIANVDVTIQVWLGGSWGWVNGPTNSGDVRSGGGSGNRVTARWPCTNSTSRFTFRSVIDVDIIGYSDPAEKLYTAPQTIACGL